MEQTTGASPHQQPAAQHLARRQQEASAHPVALVHQQQAQVSEHQQQAQVSEHQQQGRQ